MRCVWAFHEALVTFSTADFYKYLFDKYLREITKIENVHQKCFLLSTEQMIISF